jgi:hypothetical protein
MVRHGGLLGTFSLSFLLWQASSDEAATNYDMQAFYEQYLDTVRDDQRRYDGIAQHRSIAAWQHAMV